MYALWRVIVKEFLQIRRDRKMIPVIFVAPIVQIVVFGYAVNTDVTDVPTVLVDQDRSTASRDLVSRFLESGYFEIVATEDRADEVDRWLVTSKAQLGLVVGQGFGAALASGRPAAVQLVVDGTDAATANVALGYAGALVRDVGAEALATQLRAFPRGARAGRGRARPARPLQPRPEEPLVLRSRRPRHDPHGHDDAALRDGRRAREGDRHDGADHRHADPAVAAARREAPPVRAHRRLARCAWRRQ